MPFVVGSTRRKSAGSHGGIPPAGAPRPLSRARLAFGVCMVLVFALFLVPGAQAVLDPAGNAAYADNDLKSLKDKAEKSKDELEKATKAYTKREKALENAQDDLVKTLHKLQQTELKLSDMREPLAKLAVTMYKQPDVGAASLVTSGSIASDLQAESHVLKLSQNQEALLEEANGLKKEQQGYTTKAQDLQSNTQLEKVELEDDLDKLKKKSKTSTDKLLKELKDRGLSVEAYKAGVECDPAKGAAAADYPNGLLPQDALCELHEDDHSLRADAAIDFLKMNEAYTKEFGNDICLTSSYRDLSNQQRVYVEQPPGNAAVPGTSNHGLGQAVDLCGGVQNEGTPQFNWLEANSTDYGWFHPQWAYSSPFEPWHWEYKTE